MYEEYRIGEITMSDRTEFIDRQAAIDAVRSYYDECDEREESIEERIEQLPSAQPTQLNTPNTLEALDCISRQAAIYAVHKSILDFFYICDDDEESPMTYKDERLLELNKAITTQIKAVPSAQPDIIRCKDCRWYKTNYMWNGTEVKICAKEAYEPRRNADDFCSNGERK